jgi:putative ABC transport system ATP-binding protein
VIEIRVRATVGATTIEADIFTTSLALALVGPSGGGKTTLLNLVAGLLTPDEGRIAIGGTALFDSAAGVDVPARRRRLGYVFQEPRLFPHYSVAGNLRYGARAAADGGLVGFDEIVARLGVGALLGRRPAKLSGGEKQRVAIARALAKAPALIFADEPTSALDSVNGQVVIKLLHEAAKERNAAIIVVTHDPRLEGHADRIIHMEDGNILSDRMISEPPSIPPVSSEPPA